MFALHIQGAWKGRQNAAAALDVVDNFYSALLSSTLAHDIQVSAYTNPADCTGCASPCAALMTPPVNVPAALASMGFVSV